MPIPVLLYIAAVMAVVPLPEYGSNTVSPSLVKQDSESSGILGGNGAVCPYLFSPPVPIFITGEKLCIFHFNLLCINSSLRCKGPSFLKMNMCS